MEKPFVLIADDNEATRTLITALLQSDFVIEVASDGNETIEKLKNRQYGAILLDLRMPVVDGYAVLDFLRDNRPDVLAHVLVVTASLSQREMARVQGYEVCGVIAKPFEVDSLFNAVRHCAGNGGAHTLAGPFLAGGMIFLLGELLRRVQ